MDMISEWTVTHSQLACFAIGSFVLSLIYGFYHYWLRCLPCLPWVGRQREWFSNFRARKRAMIDPGAMHREGYEKVKLGYSKNDRPFLFPTLDGCDTIILPPSQIGWLSTQPETMLSAMDAMRTLLQTDHMFDPHVLHNPVQNFTTRVLLTRKLPQMIPGMIEELGVAFDQFLGTDTEDWKEVHIVEALREISARVTNRAFVGEELCRDKDYLDSLLQVAASIGISAAYLRYVPWPLKRLVGLYITRRYHSAFRNVAQYTNPVVLRRIEDIRARERGELKTSEPEDFLQAMIHQSLLQPTKVDATPNMITLRLMLMNFASVQNLSKAGSNTILDLVNSTEQPVLDVLRSEIDTFLADRTSVPTKEQLSKMEKLDSVIKESMRVSHVATVGFHRQVRAKGGLRLWNGQWAPEGALLGTSAISLHHDKKYYENPLSWDPFRFYKDSWGEHESVNIDTLEVSQRSKEDTKAEYIRQKKNALTSTSDTYLAFGHGVHACPGRFYSAVALKLLVIVLLQRYELRPQPKRAENVWESGAFIPSSQACVEIMRKKE